MDSFLTTLQANPMDYKTLNDYYKSLQNKTSSSNLSDQEKKDLNLMSSVFSNQNETSSVKNIDQNLFKKLSKNDNELSYQDFTDLKKYDYERYIEAEDPSYSYLFAAYGHILDNVDISLFKGEKSEPLNSDYYFDDNDNLVTNEEKITRSKEELDKTIKYFKSGNHKFKDANGSEINIKDLIAKYEASNGSFEIDNGDELTFQQSNFAINSTASGAPVSYVIKINSKETDLFSNKNINPKTGLNESFSESILHELMHFNDFTKNYNSNLKKFTSKESVIPRESYAEKSAIIAEESLKNQRTDATTEPQLKNYASHEYWFLQRYK